MAPNVRQLTVLPDSLVDIGQLVHSKVPALSSSPGPSSSYWDWPAKKDDVRAEEEETSAMDLFSATHLQANLIQASISKIECESSVIPEHDDYWAEVAPARAAAKPLHRQHDIYWDESSRAILSPSDAYWSETSCRHYKGAPAANYWNEANHARSASDEYWVAPSSSSSSSSFDIAYWDEKPHVLTASDRYWSMATCATTAVP